MHESLTERLATMTEEELRAALVATAEGDRTHAAEFFAKCDNDRLEVMEDMAEAVVVN